MGDQRAGGIAWTDETWNVVRGCSRVSRGCEHCYAERTAAFRLSGEGQAYHGLAEVRHGRPRWTGKVVLVPERLHLPLGWTRPRKVFVNATSDLFHEVLPFDVIAAVFGVMAAAPAHVFQVVTKRPARALAFFAWLQAEAVDKATSPWFLCHLHARRFCTHRRLQNVGPSLLLPWPLRNVWILASTEGQKELDERVPLLLRVPAVVRGISAEPLLEPLNLSHYLRPRARPGHCVTIDGDLWHLPGTCVGAPVNCSGDCCADGLDWVVIGGESGAGARPFDLRWAGDIIRQCRRDHVPPFMKQAGSWPVTGAEPHANAIDARVAARITHHAGGILEEWPAELQVQEWPRAWSADHP